MVANRSSHVTKKHGNHPKDKLSQLPDEVIVSVLSRLTIKEAARTSVLSRRWEKMWTSVTSLNFDASKTLFDGMARIKILTPKFMNWVNQALKSHQGQTIDEFGVHFYLHNSSSSDIDNWINFAIKRRVQRLELVFGYMHCWPHRENYTFPLWALKISSFNSLTDLRLSCVDVTGEVLEHCLYKCRFLERLRVDSSRCLVNLKVSGLSLKLKILEISYCFKFESIDISANNLESFKYVGRKINMPFKIFQSLSKASFGGDFCWFVIDNFCQLSSYFTRLETLILHIYLTRTTELFNLTVLSNVKHLELIVSGSSCNILPFLTPLMKAFPFLHRFVLQNEGFYEYDEQEPTKCPHQCLKVVEPHQSLTVVELLGFVGSAEEVELTMYLIVNAVSIEKIVFDTRRPSLVGTPWEFHKVEEQQEARKRAEQQEARKRARQLGGKLPLGVDLVVII